MELWEVLDNVKRLAGLSDRALSERMRRSSGYYSALKAQNRDLQYGTVVRILGACGYVLAALPADRVPDGALVIGSGAEGDDQDAS